jgi:hypothetical protein
MNMLNGGKHCLDRVSPLSAAIFAAIVAFLVSFTIGYVVFAPQSPRSVPVTTTSPAVPLPPPVEVASPPPVVEAPPVEVASPAPLATVEAKPKRYVIGNANHFVHGVPDRGDWDEFAAALRKAGHDQTEMGDLAQMVDQGRVIGIGVGTAIKVVEPSSRRSCVEILDGPNKGQQAWILTMYIVAQ